MTLVGLRYFNVFGPRQSPDRAYAAVIPRWFARILSGQSVDVYGDGETSRDFCYVDNVVQANLLAATTTNPAALDQIFNVACADRTTLTQLFELIRDAAMRFTPLAKGSAARQLPFREGDIRHSHADISKITRLLGYASTRDVRAGLAASADWYASRTR